MFYKLLAEGPGVARETKKNLKKKFRKKLQKLKKKFFFKPITPPANHECPQKIQPNRSSRLAGYRQHLYKYECLVLLYRYVSSMLQGVPISMEIKWYDFFIVFVSRGIIT